ncbi:hypothetical protein ACWT_4326 [Actinoplanes sp. SE50]|uniref:hypothetical protein n=1 Tax=unclassified Actinoplanes TaxID=2626549 RepID=UPI00023EC7FE|nr:MULTISPECIES: hypothetical protein [unclassified Actinoplanes]AEV85346.1 hypothetical protein ACPL_4455 [Actinoplanes sp. SE50/110]ATO83741.1 hypothetical protein ACWT_4326 [Actinoplanes sp. SE50]SLM01149.1 hypothetical protein ACSP50_4382 [Actinoplanes sp. SE50/110]
MGRTRKSLLIVGPLAAGVVVAATAVRRRGAAPPTRRRHVLTVYKPLSELESTQLPGSLREIADRVEISLAAAPGGRGTEIAVRIPDGSPVTDGDVRRALRETRSLIEAGDVLLPSGPATTTPTLLNRPLQAATRNGREGGLL